MSDSALLKEPAIKKHFIFLTVFFLNLFFASMPCSAEDAASKFILPIPDGSALSEVLGLWPFGVRGGDHPQGHPGFDFEARVGTPILAAADGSVGYVGQSGHHQGNTISIGHMTSLGWVDTIYTGSISPIKMKKGDRVKQGDVIATLDSAEDLGLPPDISTFHFGVARHVTQERIEEVCPTEYFTGEAQKELERLHQESKYQERNEFPLLCNACPPGGCR